MPKTTITVDTPIEDCGISCPHFKVDDTQMLRNGMMFYGVYRCEHYDSCEEALYQAGELKDVDDEEE